MPHVLLDYINCLVVVYFWVPSIMTHDYKFSEIIPRMQIYINFFPLLDFEFHL